MKYKKLLLGTVAVATTITVSAIVVTNSKPGLFINTHGESESYKMECSNGVNQLHNEVGVNNRKSGQTVLKTKLDNDVTFQYNNTNGFTGNKTFLNIGPNYLFIKEPLV